MKTGEEVPVVASIERVKSIGSAGGRFARVAFFARN
jgi:hypothetical protein